MLRVKFGLTSSEELPLALLNDSIHACTSTFINEALCPVMYLCIAVLNDVKLQVITDMVLA